MARRWVLLVIDDATALTTVEEVVRGLGFHVTTAPDAAQGDVQARDLKPVLVISDKPRVDGGYAGRPFLLLTAPLEPEQLKQQIALQAKEPVAAPQPVATPIEAAPPPAEVKHWIVVASSDPVTPTIIDMALLGLDLETAAVSEASQTTAQVESLKPELFLCDLDLPGLPDGVAVLQALRRNPGTSAIPLLLISARDADEDLSKILAFDTTVRFHKKPLDAEKLRALIMSLLAGEPAPAAPEPSVAAAPPQRGTALILEADPVTRALIESVLRDIGLKASPGDAATALTAAADLKPALIVSDLSVPGAVAVLTDMRLDPLLREIPFLFMADMPVEQAMSLVPWGDETVRFTKKPLDLAKVRSLAAELTGWPTP